MHHRFPAIVAAILVLAVSASLGIIARSSRHGNTLVVSAPVFDRTPTPTDPPIPNRKIALVTTTTTRPKPPPPPTVPQRPVVVLLRPRPPVWHPAHPNPPPARVAPPAPPPPENDDADKLRVYTRESGNRTSAVNPSNGACGLGQALPCSKLPCSLSDYGCQDAWFTGYMRQVYGSWSNAWAHEVTHGWW